MLLRYERQLVGVTQAGEKFVADVSRSLRILNDAVLTSRAIASGNVGTLRIGVSEPALAVAFGRVLRECRRNLPDVGLMCRETQNNDQIHALRDNQLDVGLVAQPCAANCLGSEPLWSEGRLVFLPEDHVPASQEQVTVDGTAVAGVGAPKLGRVATVNIMAEPAACSRSRGRRSASGSGAAPPRAIVGRPKSPGSGGPSCGRQVGDDAPCQHDGTGQRNRQAQEASAAASVGSGQVRHRFSSAGRAPGGVEAVGKSPAEATVESPA